MDMRAQQEQERIQKVRKYLHKASKALQNLSDEAGATALGGGALDEFMRALLPLPSESSLGPYAFLQRYRHRGELVGLLRHAISENYAMKSRLDNGAEVFISPSHAQWYEDAVMFFQGSERFGGGFCRIGLTDPPAKIEFGYAARDVSAGGKMGPEEFQFIPLEEARTREAAQMGENRQPRGVYERAIQDLRDLLVAKVEDEAQYQRHLQRHPWMLGLEYSAVEAHRRFDDETIPDFTGVRATDRCRDIIEIKPPFLDLFKKDGAPSMTFMETWHQAERYLDYARKNQDFLSRQKNLRFENPKCYLLIGTRFSDEQRSQIRIKESSNPSIRVLTYFDLISYAEHTLNILTSLGAARAIESKSMEGSKGNTTASSEAP